MTTERSWAEVKDELPPESHRCFHISRIAHLAREQVTHGEHKIAIGIAPDRVWVVDGNHRIAAAPTQFRTSALRTGGNVCSWR